MYINNIFIFFKIPNIKDKNTYLNNIDKVIINIGYNCCMRDVFDHFNLRNYSYPFNTKLIPLDSLIEFIKDDLKYF